MGMVEWPLGMQETPRLTPEYGTFSLEDLNMKILLQLHVVFLFRLFKKSNCQLMAKECTLNTCKLPLGHLPSNGAVRITDRPEMISAVNRGRKVTKKKKRRKMIMIKFYVFVRVK